MPSDLEVLEAIKNSLLIEVQLYLYVLQYNNSFEVLTCYFYYNLKDEFSEIGGDYVLGDDDDMPEVQL